MGRTDRSSREIAARLAEGLAELTATASAMRTGWQRGREPVDPQQRMAVEHARAQQQYQRDLARHRGRLTRLRTRAQVFTATGITAGTVAVLDVVTGPAALDAWFWVGAPTAVVSAWLARGAKAKAATLPEPPPPAIPPPPPRPLPPGTRGAAESAALHQLRLQLAQLLPAVTSLHADAAAELRRADLEAAPALGALVERLALLHRVEVELPRSTAAAAAAASGDEIRARLGRGVARYEDLITATVALLAAPDDAAPNARLTRSVLELAAYSEGLRVAAATMPDRDAPR